MNNNFGVNHLDETCSTHESLEDARKEAGKRLSDWMEQGDYCDTIEAGLPGLWAVEVFSGFTHETTMDCGTVIFDLRLKDERAAARSLRP